MKDLLTYLDSDERAALAETKAWMEQDESRFKKVLGVTRKPIEFVYKKVPESVRESIASAILNVLTSVRDGTANLTSVNDVRLKVAEVHGPLEAEHPFARVPIAQLDAVAGKLIKGSKNACTAEGAATGVAGLPGIVVDVPALYALLFRMISQLSVVYGFDFQPEEERTHMLKLLEIGHQVDAASKRSGMKEVEELQDMIRRNIPVVEVQRFAIQKGLQTLARHLGLALTQRKLAQTVVLVGGVIGAGVNRQLAGEVGEVAFHAYRRRHLIDRAQLRKDGVLPWAATPMSAKKSFLPRPPSYD
ncbi:MAG: EcsC family protein [Candidatus Eremiobacteraeota bacterium]|nr:EcsC family protein [Candidatus Eremiobacteraeota bacterium]